MRPVLALVAAYAVALQAVLLAAAGPVGFADSFVVCSHSGAGDTGPIGPGCDCLANCLAGCCAAYAAPLPQTAVFDAAGYPPAVDVSMDAASIFRQRLSGAHRSRAPPLG
jgi:hypothetical protein